MDGAAHKYYQETKTGDVFSSNVNKEVMQQPPDIIIKKKRDECAPTTLLGTHYFPFVLTHFSYNDNVIFFQRLNIKKRCFRIMNCITSL